MTMQDMQTGATCKTCGGGHMGCKCFHHKVVPLSIALIGLCFFLQAFALVSVSFVSVVWPLLLMLIGVMKLSKGSCKCCSKKM